MVIILLNHQCLFSKQYETDCFKDIFIEKMEQGQHWVSANKTKIVGFNVSKRGLI